MQELTPINGRIAVEPKLRSKDLEDQLNKKIPGFVYQAPDGMEGLPDRGIVYKLPEDYDGDLKVGDYVVFKEDKPKGYKWDGRTLFFLKPEQIVCTLEEE